MNYLVRLEAGSDGWARLRLLPVDVGVLSSSSDSWISSRRAAQQGKSGDRCQHAGDKTCTDFARETMAKGLVTWIVVLLLVFLRGVKVLILLFVLLIVLHTSPEMSTLSSQSQRLCLQYREPEPEQISSGRGDGIEARLTSSSRYDRPTPPLLPSSEDSYPSSSSS